MKLMDLTPLSISVGILVIVLTAFMRFHFPFRYQYVSVLFRKHPYMVKKILERSYLKNRTAVGLLDKATKEILDAEYDKAEKYVIEGIQRVIHVNGIRNQLIRTFFYSHLSWILYYKGNHQESLEIAIRLYEKVPSTPNLLALISCNLARVGEIGRAIEVHSKLKKMKKVNPAIRLSCEAEIEAAKGNLKKAVRLFSEAKEVKSHASVYFIIQEIEKRIGQLQKTAL